MINLNYNSAIKYARSIAKGVELNLVEDEKVKGPCTDGRNIYMPPYDPHWKDTHPLAIQWWGHLIHEVYHNLPENEGDFDILKRENIHHSSLLGRILNLVTDWNIEWKEHGKLVGRDERLSKATATWRSKDLDKEKEFMDGRHRADCASFIWDSELRKSWMPNMASHDFAGTLEDDPDAIEMYNKLQVLNEDYTIHRDSEGNLEFAKRIIETLGLDYEEELKNAQEMAEKAASAKAGKGSEGGEEEEGVGEPWAKYEDVLEHKHKITEEGPSYVPMTIDYSTYESTGSYLPIPIKVINTKDLTNINNTYLQQISSENTGNSLSTSIKKYLLAISRSTYQGGKTSGRLHAKNMHRLITSKGTLHEKQIFKKKVQRNILNTAISLRVDQSGSMGGSKFVHAAHSAVLLNEVFAKIGIPTEIGSFTDTDDEAIEYIHKKYDAKISRENLIISFAKSADDKMWGNSDGDNILWAAGQLLQRKEHRKVMIVLSDGQPAASRCGQDVYTYTKDVVKEIETNSPIEIYGIGIQSAVVANIYKEYDVIQDCTTLESTLLKLLTQKVLK